MFKNNIAVEISDFELNDDQKKAVDKIRDWYFSNKKQVPFRLVGSAGTGKTSIIQFILKELNLSEHFVEICAYTGKASLVLKRKGLDAKTIHSLIYETKIVKSNDGTFVYLFKKRLEINAKLIIVDEASMVSESIYRDLVSFKVPILFIGDPYQLPPINDSFNPIKSYDYLLTQIVRQAEDNPILVLSEMARNNHYIDIGDYSKNGFNVKKISIQDLHDDILLSADQILVGKNETRININNYIRKLKGFKNFIEEEEKLIVLKNCYRKNLVNGQQLYAHSKQKRKTNGKFKLTYVDVFEWDNIEYIIASDEVEKESFFSFNYLEAPITKHSDVVFADYGYAITVHKSQGSSWDKVIVLNDWKSSDGNRWLYTAITRANKDLILVDL